MNQPALNQFALWQYIDPPLYVGVGKVFFLDWTISVQMPYQEHKVALLYELLPILDLPKQRFWIPSHNRFVISTKISDKYDPATVGAVFFLGDLDVHPFATLLDERGESSMMILNLELACLSVLRDGIPIRTEKEKYNG